METRKVIQKSRNGTIKKLNEIPFKPCEEFTEEIMKTNNPNKWKELAEKHEKRYLLENVDLDISPDTLIHTILASRVLQNDRQILFDRFDPKKLTLRSYCAFMQKAYMSWEWMSSENPIVDRILAYWCRITNQLEFAKTYVNYFSRSKMFPVFYLIAEKFDTFISPATRSLFDAMNLFKGNLALELPLAKYEDQKVVLNENAISIVDLFLLMDNKI